MARVKQAVLIIQNQIEEIGSLDDYYFIKGMVNMAERLDRITFYEGLKLLNQAYAKYKEVKEGL